MIDINELKPILEPLLSGDDTADVIDRIREIDRPGVTQADLDNLNKEWTERYRKAFFEGPDNSVTGNHDSEQQAEEQAGEEEKTTFEDLFSSEE